MNIFILNTGRCGSTTFIKACQHITNYSSGHETLSAKTGSQRLLYSENHIEADNRLSWFLGRLDEKYSNDAFYVHLQRDQARAAASFVKRQSYGIMQAYEQGILQGIDEKHDPEQIALDYIYTVTANINHFLKDKDHKMDFRLENAKDDFILFWNAVNAEGNLNAALQEWDVTYNAS